jgi:hypothetical protein
MGMIRVSTADPEFNQAYLNAFRALAVERMESPRQYGARWRSEYQCRVDGSDEFPHNYYVFDRDEDNTWFILKWG